MTNKLLQITAASNPKLKGLRKLRVGFGKPWVLVEGWKLIQEALRADWLPEQLWVTQTTDATLDCPCYLVSPSLYTGISPTKKGQAPLAVFQAPQLALYSAQEQVVPSLLLDQLQDPGNAGALVRAAAAFGFKRIIWHKPSIYPFHHACIRASAGTVFHLQHRLLESEAIDSLVGDTIGADLDGKALPTFEWPETPILIMGNEGHGLSQAIARTLKAKVTIPMDESAESLNVAGAAHVLMYDFASKQSSHLS